MLIVGVDVPLIEILLVLCIINVIILAEVIVVVVLLMRSLRKIKS